MRRRLPPWRTRLIAVLAAQRTVPSTGEVRLRRWLDVAALRDQRLRVSARVRTDDPGGDVHVEIATGDTPSTFRPRARASGRPSLAWTDIDTVLDIAPG